MTPCVRQRGAYIDVWADRAVLSIVATAARAELRDDALFLSIVVPHDERVPLPQYLDEMRWRAWEIATALRVIDAWWRRPRVVQP